MAYIGRPLQVANLAVQSGTGDGSDTTPIATLDYATTTNGIAVYLDGVRQLAGTDFNVTAQTTLTFTTAPANGVGVDVYFLGLELSLPTPADGTVATAKIADDAVTLAKMAPGTDGNIISYDASGNPVAIATGTDGQVLTSTGAGSPPAFEALPAGVADVKFLAFNSATDSNVTGNNTTVTVDFDTEVYDTGNDFASDTFTAPSTGKYLLTFSIMVSGMTSAADVAELKLVTSNRVYEDEEHNIDKIANAQYTGSMTAIADMDASDTAHVTIAITGIGADTADITGSGTILHTYFSGALLA